MTGRLWRLRSPRRRLVFVPPPKAQRRTGNLRRVSLAIVRVVVALTVLSGTLLGVTLSVQPAQADLLCDLTQKDVNPTNIGPEKYNAGTTAWVPFLAKEDVKPAGGPKHPRQFGAQHAPDDYTLWEVVGPRGLKWSYSPQALRPEHRGTDKFDKKSPEDNFEKKCSIADASGVMVAQMIWEISRFLAGLTIGLKQIATADAPFAPFYSEQSRLIDLLRSQLFIPALAVGVLITGFWVALRVYRRGEARETYAGVLGAAVVVVLLVAILSGGNYQKLTGAIDKYTSDFNSAILNILANPQDGEAELSPCYLPATTLSGGSAQTAPGYAPPPDEEGDPEPHLTYNRGKRLSSCMLYRLLLFDPWRIGQFGTGEVLHAPNLWYNTDQEPGQDGYCTISPYRCVASNRPDGTEVNIAIQQVIAQAYTRNETITTDETDPKIDRTFYPPASEPNRLQLWKGVQYAVADKYPQHYDTWKGSEPTGRMATAIGAAVMNLIVLIAIGFIAVLTIFWHGVLFVAWILLPVVAAVAIFPPARRVLRAVLGIMVQAVFLRSVFGLVLAVLLAVMSAIQVADGPTAMKIILMIIAALAIWKLLTALRSGALSPQVAQEAAQLGVMPSDEGVDRGFRRGRSMAGSMVRGTGAAATGLAATAARRQYGRMAGGRAGAEAARAATPHQEGTVGYKIDVAAGRAEGARQGGRSQTRLGRMRQAAEYQANTRIDRVIKQRKQIQDREGEDSQGEKRSDQDRNRDDRDRNRNQDGSG